MPKARKKRQRRVRGTGSVFFDKNRGVHVAKQIIGRNANGKAQYIQRTGQTALEASRRLSEALGVPFPASGRPTWEHLREQINPDVRAAVEAYLIAHNAANAQKATLASALESAIVMYLTSKGHWPKR